MKISSKGRYALRTMVDIAKSENEFVPISDVSHRQDISQKYLESIISMLVKSGLLFSARGANGGYKLTKKPQDYTLKEILSVTGDTPNFVACASDNTTSCPRIYSCDTAGCWVTLTGIINDYLDKITLKDLIDKTYNK